MATDLTTEFDAGRAARLSSGRCLEGGNVPCPYLATSPAADAWWTGWAHECNRMAGNSAACEPVKSATKGRGDSVNVNIRGGKMHYRMDYSREGCPAYLVEA